MVESTHTAGLWPSLTEPFRSFGSRIADWFAPPSEANAEKDAYEITVELPGVKREDIDISLKDQVLSVKGEKRTKTEKKEGATYFCERQYGAFQRSFRLPSDAALDKIEASFADGVLTLRVPRQSKAENAQKIAIRSD